MHPHIATRRACRTGAVAAGTAALLAATAATALAGGYGSVTTSCTSSQQACSVGAQTYGGSATGTTSSGTGSGSSSQTGASSPSQVTCTDITPTATQLVAFGSPKPPSGKGHWVIVRCLIAGGLGFPTTLHWQADGAPALPDPAVLAAQAESKLVLAKPTVDSSPAAGTDQVVQLPTWAWIPRAQWAPISATASVPGESVTATATPAALSFSWGDGTSTTCQGPGTPYTAGTSNPAAPSPTCGHTYLETSAQAPGQQFPVTASIAWSIAWNGGGASGTLPQMTTSTTVHWTVAQIQSVLVNGQGG